MLEVKVKTDTREEIVFNITIDEEYEYLVEVNLIDNTEDTFSIRVCDIIHADVNPHNDNEVMYGMFDSDGGTFEGFKIDLDLEKGNNQEIVNILEKEIIEILFNERNGLTTKYNYNS